MKNRDFCKVYTLTAENIDIISDKIGELLDSLKMERNNMLRIRLSMEEALIRWQEHFGEDKEVLFEIGSFLGKPHIKLNLYGESFDPLNHADSDLGEWSNSLLSNIGLSPSFTYAHRRNTLVLKIDRPNQNTALLLLFSIFWGLGTGILTDQLLPASVKEYILVVFLDPIQDMFFRMVNTIAVPVIFLTVLAATCGAGSVASQGKSNRHLIFHFIWVTSLCTLISDIIAVPIFGMSLEVGKAHESQFAGALDLFFHMVPGDIVSPFLNGETPQLLFVAIILGNALLVLGSRSDTLVHIVDQANNVGLKIADWMSRTTSIFVMLLLTLAVWKGDIWKILGLWKVLLTFGVISFVILGSALISTSGKYKVPVKKLILKMKDSFIVAFKTSSVNTAFALSQQCCNKRLGIDPKFLSYTQPLGMVLFMPTGTIAISLFSLYAAWLYDIDTSLVFYLTVLLLSVALQTASPPVAGVNLLTYAAIFKRMGIPNEAIVVAMVADILFLFLASAVDQALLQLDLVHEADTRGELNEKVLRA